MAKTKPDTQQLKELQEKYARALADYHNLEKRTGQDIQNRLLYEKKLIFSNILDILDDLERAQSHLNDSGIQMILDSFNSYLRSQGVEEIDTTDQTFDPDTMECLEKIGDGDTVTATLTKGYKLNDTVLRPARVRVGNQE